jgi:hypothetical protein
VVIGTDANKDILDQSGLLTPEAQAAVADDLVIVVRAEDDAAAQVALAEVASPTPWAPAGVISPRQMRG